MLRKNVLATYDENNNLVVRFEEITLVSEKCFDLSTNFNSWEEADQTAQYLSSLFNNLTYVSMR